jgi:alkylation response protein AidB-like acyl-CoA dehydrogenase
MLPFKKKKAVPTAELSLSGTVGHLLSPLGEGLAAIPPILNITRLYCSVSPVWALNRALDIAKSYASVRFVGGLGPSGSLLSQNEMHVGWLVQIEVLHRALLHFAFGVIALLGKSEENKDATDSETLRLNLLVPVVKAFAAECAVAGIADCMESLGGQGYMTENQLGRLLQDAMVERIWEG